MNNELFWIWLSSALGADSECYGLLSAFDGSPYKVCCASQSEIIDRTGWTRKKVEKLKSFPIEEAEKFLRISNEHGWSVITPPDGLYPKRLLKFTNPPLALYVQGNEKSLKNEMSLSIVGSRKSSDYGKAVARSLSSILSDYGFTIVSGGALGVDSAAHLGALDEGNATICVMGCGLGTRYLMDNEPMRRRIAEKGAVISEFPPFYPAGKFTFPKRNRIISGMTAGTVVVEAGEKSGSLITANLAFRQGRHVFAVPGDLVNAAYAGTNTLLRNGAVPVYSHNDILETYFPVYGSEFEKLGRMGDDEIARRAKRYLAPSVKTEIVTTENVKHELPDGSDFISEKAKKVYALLGDEPVHTDEITRMSGLSAKEALAALTELELCGFIRQLSGKRYKIGR